MIESNDYDEDSHGMEENLFPFANKKGKSPDELLAILIKQPFCKLGLPDGHFDDSEQALLERFYRVKRLFEFLMLLRLQLKIWVCAVKMQDDLNKQELADLTQKTNQSPELLSEKACFDRLVELDVRVRVVPIRVRAIEQMADCVGESKNFVEDQYRKLIEKQGSDFLQNIKDQSKISESQTYISKLRIYYEKLLGFPLPKDLTVKKHAETIVSSLYSEKPSTRKVISDKTNETNNNYHQRNQLI